jgi:hypothetical protein
VLKRTGKKVLMNLLKASDIPQSIQGSESQEVSTSWPYIVVRALPKGYPLKEYQYLKFGKTQMIVTEIARGLLDEEAMLRKGEILNADEDLEQKGVHTQRETIRSRQENEDDSEGNARCRFCLADDEAGNMISPCACSGYSKHIHFECLKEWLEKKYRVFRVHQLENEPPRLQYLACEVCKKELPKVVIKNGVKLYCLDLFKKDAPYVTLQKVEELYRSHQVERYMMTLDRRLPGIQVGRAETSSIPLEEPSVSRRHALISRNQEGEIMVTDQSSKFGTLLYDQQAELQLEEWATRVIQI